MLGPSSGEARPPAGAPQLLQRHAPNLRICGASLGPLRRYDSDISDVSGDKMKIVGGEHASRNLGRIVFMARGECPRRRSLMAKPQQELQLVGCAGFTGGRGVPANGGHGGRVGVICGVCWAPANWLTVLERD